MGKLSAKENQIYYIDRQNYQGSNEEIHKRRKGVEEIYYKKVEERKIICFPP